MPDDRDECRFQVKVDIKPMWLRPATSMSQEVGRKQSEVRFETFAYEIAAFIEAKLDQMVRDHGDDVSQWVLPMRMADGSWFTGGGPKKRGN